VTFENTAARLWKRLPREERLAAATAFWAEPPAESVGAALGAIVQARHLRPQVARSMPPAEQARILASIGDLGEPLAASLLVTLHLGQRRPLLGTFLDALGLAHEDGILKDEGDMPPVAADALRKGIEAMRASHSPQEIRTYLNTLWLQDPDRWKELADLPDVE
jgi:hypothetical protein